MTPPDCVLNYPWMPLYGHKLYGSYFDAHATDAEWRAAHRLWWFAWNEKPAASVPNDDVMLCKAAGLGRDLKAWSKVKEMALHDFVMCTDGRLYHQFLAEEAIKAFDLRLKADKKRKSDRERLRRWREERALSDEERGTPPDESSQRNAGRNGGRNARETRFVAGKQYMTVHDKEISERSSGSVPPPASAREQLWREGLAVLLRLTGMPPPAGRRLLGQLLKPMRDDCAGLLVVLREAEQSAPIDPVPWLQAAVLRRTSSKPGEMDLLRAKLGNQPLQWTNSEPDNERLALT
jgi:hypothetical protein